ncbi:MAG: hypothetical protein JWQ95_1203 [Sphaerisporangium sp.]|nr:hypothetical protein [Sphaerisporangium sp.]
MLERCRNGIVGNVVHRFPFGAPDVAVWINSYGVSQLEINQVAVPVYVGELEQADLARSAVHPA